LFLLDTTEPQTPSRENSQHTTESSTTDSGKSFLVALEGQQSSPQVAQSSPEMESLKRKLSSTRRPETANRNLLPELNQYRQNNVALQKQIESLMAKLNESKQSERALTTSLDEMTQQCNEWQEKVQEASKAGKSAQALQNTIDHLENRLEIANIEKLDAEEQLFLIQAQKSPFDSHLSGFQAPPAVHHDPIKVS
jgi:chromosome segregation ATPase